jgi:hypothetical protein
MRRKWILAHICYAFGFAPEPGVTIHCYGTGGSWARLRSEDQVDGDVVMRVGGGKRPAWVVLDYRRGNRLVIHFHCLRCEQGARAQQYDLNRTTHIIG